LQDEGLGFEWIILEASSGGDRAIGTDGARYQLEAGGYMLVRVGFLPNRVGVVETVLVAQTNAGRFELQLRGEGIES